MIGSLLDAIVGVIVIVIVIVVVGANVIVAALVSGNDIVDVIGLSWTTR